MPSSEGDEVEVVLSKGFREQNLHLVDRNPAIVAHLKRKFPRATTYGEELSRAVSRMREKGVLLTAANFDLCSCWSPDTQLLVESVIRETIYTPLRYTAVTLLRGREQQGAFTPRHESEVSKILAFCRKRGFGWPQHTDGSPVTFDDLKRMAALILSTTVPETRALKIANRSLGMGVYKSTAGSQTMVWMIRRTFQGSVDEVYFQDKIGLRLEELRTFMAIWAHPPAPGQPASEKELVEVRRIGWKILKNDPTSGLAQSVRRCMKV